MDEIHKFHFFVWSQSYGWQHLGLTDGYETIEELKKGCSYHIENRHTYKIMKLHEVQ